MPCHVLFYRVEECPTEGAVWGSRCSVHRLPAPPPFRRLQILGRNAQQIQRLDVRSFQWREWITVTNYIILWGVLHSQPLQITMLVCLCKRVHSQQETVAWSICEYTNQILRFFITWFPDYTLITTMFLIIEVQCIMVIFSIINWVNYFSKIIIILRK